MKIAITGDWHLTNRKPECRKDDYITTQEYKVRTIFKKMAWYGANVLLQPGDLTDKWESPDRFKTRIIRLLRGIYAYNVDHPHIVSVPGQHDIRYHTSPIENTPYGVLSVGFGLEFIVASNRPLTIEDGVCFYGAAWNQQIPEIENKDNFNVLIAHRMISKKSEWPGMKYDAPGTLLRRTGYDLIVSGDNHKTIEYSKGGKTLLNAGSLMRSRIDQNDHKPCMYIFDTEKRTYEKIYIPILPFRKVADYEKAKEEDEKNERLSALISTLKNRSKIKGIDFRVNMSNTISILKKNKEIRGRAYEIYEELFSN